MPLAVLKRIIWVQSDLIDHVKNSCIVLCELVNNQLRILYYSNYVPIEFYYRAYIMHLLPSECW